MTNDLELGTQKSRDILIESEKLLKEDDDNVLFESPPSRSNSLVVSGSRCPSACSEENGVISLKKLPSKKSLIN